MQHIHPDDVTRLGSEIAAVTGPTSDGKFTTEYRVIHPDGSVHWLAIGVQVIFEGEGEERHSVMGYGTSLDITERKISEKALIQSQESFAKAFSSNPTALAITRNADGKFININDTYSSIMGYDPLEVIGHNALELSIYVDPKEREGLLQVLAEKGKVLNYELTVQRKDQEIREILVSMEPINYNNEDCILSAFVDITELKQAQQALLSSQKLLQSIIDNTPALVYTLDKDGRFLLINRPLEKLFGHTNAEMIGYRREDFVPLELAQQHRANDLEIFQSGEGKTFEEENMEPDGRHVYLTTKFPLRDAEGNIYAVCGISTDMTERKLIEEELIRSNAELEQFAYIASHDLQEPLRAVAGMVQLLQKRYQGQLDERANEYIGHAVEASARMQSLIQALLSYSRAQRNKQPIEQVDAETSLQTAIKNLDVSIRESHAVITTDALPHVHADPLQLTQLFQNLIGNGIKFRRDVEPQIHISATKLADAWQFSVRDNGIGIEPQYFERIFMIFQRLHTQREYSGTGIGLALCKKIIERHGGRIWVESEPEHGSVFHFTLPLRSNS
jgi:PAS domain S-box-containing protein